MNEPSYSLPPSIDQLPVEHGRAVDLICDFFETRLKLGDRPRIEDFVDRFEGAARSVLFREMLLLEVEHQGGGIEEYRKRFPRDIAAVDDVFGEASEPTAHPPMRFKPPAPLPEIPDYCLVRTLKTGGQGAVYLGLDKNLFNEVAVKILKLTGNADVMRFRREMQVTGNLMHPNIVAARYANVHQGQYYLVMEYVKGLDLADLLKQRRRDYFSVADACEICRKAAVALEFAHQHNLVHRDIKPSNILLGIATGSNLVEVKVTDFGLARLFDPRATTDANTGLIMGTLDYMPPEQWKNSDAVDIRADIYSLGLTLYTLLLGQPPYAEITDPRQKMEAHFRGEIPSLRIRRPDISTQLEELIFSAVATDPQERYSSPGEFARSIEFFCDGHDLPNLLQRAMQASAATPSTYLEETHNATASFAPMSNEEPTLIKAEPSSPSEDSVAPTDKLISAREPESTDPPRSSAEEGTDRQEPPRQTQSPRFSRQQLLLGVGALVIAVVLLPLVFSLGRTQPSSQDLLAKIDPLQNSLRGDWRLVDGVLVSPVGSKSMVSLPCDAAENYVLEIHASAKQGDGLVAGLVVGGHIKPILLTAQKMNPADPAEVAQARQVLATLKVEQSPNTYLIVVQGERVTAFHGSEFLSDQSQPNNRFWLPEDYHGLYLATHFSEYHIDRVHVWPID